MSKGSFSSHATVGKIIFSALWIIASTANENCRCPKSILSYVESSIWIVGIVNIDIKSLLHSRQCKTRLLCIKIYKETWQYINNYSKRWNVNSRIPETSYFLHYFFSLVACITKIKYIQCKLFYYNLINTMYNTK